MKYEMIWWVRSEGPQKRCFVRVRLSFDTRAHVREDFWRDDAGKYTPIESGAEATITTMTGVKVRKLA